MKHIIAIGIAALTQVAPPPPKSLEDNRRDRTKHYGRRQKSDDADQNAVELVAIFPKRREEQRN